MTEDGDWRSACDAMVRQTIEARGVLDPDVLRAMREVPRHAFVPSDARDHAYEDRPLPLSKGQTISQPYMVAALAEAARIGPGKRVLDVGTGSGYQAAVLAELGAEVYSIERIQSLCNNARIVLQATGYERVQLRCADGKKGWPEAAPFDAVLVAAAARHVPEPLIDQLAPGGRLLIPIGENDNQELVMLEHMPWGEIRRQTLMRVLFVPLV